MAPSPSFDTTLDDYSSPGKYASTSSDHEIVMQSSSSVPVSFSKRQQYSSESEDFPKSKPQHYASETDDDYTEVSSNDESSVDAVFRRKNKKNRKDKNKRRKGHSKKSSFNNVKTTSLRKRKQKLQDELVDALERLDVVTENVDMYKESSEDDDDDTMITDADSSIVKKHVNRDRYVRRIKKQEETESYIRPKEPLAPIPILKTPRDNDRVRQKVVSFRKRVSLDFPDSADDEDDDDDDDSTRESTFTDRDPSEEDEHTQYSEETDDFPRKPVEPQYSEETDDIPRKASFRNNPPIIDQRQYSEETEDFPERSSFRNQRLSDERQYSEETEDFPKRSSLRNQRLSEKRQYSEETDDFPTRDLPQYSEDTEDYPRNSHLAQYSEETDDLPRNTSFRNKHLSEGKSYRKERDAGYDLPPKRSDPIPRKTSFRNKHPSESPSYPKERDTEYDLPPKRSEPIPRQTSFRNKRPSEAPSYPKERDTEYDLPRKRSESIPRQTSFRNKRPSEAPSYPKERDTEYNLPRKRSESIPRQTSFRNKHPSEAPSYPKERNTDYDLSRKRSETKKNIDEKLRSKHKMNNNKKKQASKQINDTKRAKYPRHGSDKSETTEESDYNHSRKKNNVGNNKKTKSNNKSSLITKPTSTTPIRNMKKHQKKSKESLASSSNKASLDSKGRIKNSIKSAGNFLANKISKRNKKMEQHPQKILVRIPSQRVQTLIEPTIVELSSEEEPWAPLPLNNSTQTSFLRFPSYRTSVQTPAEYGSSYTDVNPKPQNKSRALRRAFSKESTMVYEEDTCDFCLNILFCDGGKKHATQSVNDKLSRLSSFKSYDDTRTVEAFEVSLAPDTYYDDETNNDAINTMPSSSNESTAGPIMADYDHTEFRKTKSKSASALLGKQRNKAYPSKYNSSPTLTGGRKDKNLSSSNMKKNINNKLKSIHIIKKNGKESKNNKKKGKALFKQKAKSKEKKKTIRVALNE